MASTFFLPLEPLPICMFWEFADSDHLMEILASQILPGEIVQSEAKFAQSPDGLLWIQPTVPLPRNLNRELRKAGATSRRRDPAREWRIVSAWWRILPPCRLPDGLPRDWQQPVIVEIPTGEELSRAMEEIQRLGGRLQGVHCPNHSGSRALLQVAGLPYFSWLAASDHESLPSRQRVFVQHVPRVWIEAGYAHPLADQILPPEDGLLLLTGSGSVVAIKQAKFQPIGERSPISVPRNPVATFHFQQAEPISVPLRLVARPATESADFWIVSLEELREWAASAGQTLLEQLAVAPWLANDFPQVLVQSLNERKPPVLVWKAKGFTSSPKIPHLFLPAGYELHPAMRAEVLQAVLNGDPETLTWISWEEPSGFRVHAVPQEAFRPLRDWVDYELVHAATRWQSWFPQPQWKIEPFEILRDGAARKAKPRRNAAIRKNENPNRRDRERTKPPLADRKKRAQPQPTASERLGVDQSAARRRLEELEQQFLASTLPIDAPELQADWQEMAGLHFLLQQVEEGLLCLSHALWNTETLNAQWLLAVWRQSLPLRWKNSEEVLADMEAGLPSLLPYWERLRKIPKPTVEDLSHLALCLVWLSASQQSSPPLAERLGEIQGFLERYEHELPLRAGWLAWFALMRLASGDVLLLARARDRFLERLFHRGIRLERDCPRFLRSWGGADGTRTPPGSGRLADFRPVLREWSQANGKLVKNLTPAYLDLILAFGLARQGDAGHAEELLEQSRDVLVRSQDPLHRWCFGAYEHRVHQALKGDNALSPLPAELLEQFEQFSKRDRFKLDRLRQASMILGPQESRDSFLQYHQGFPDDLARELASLKDIPDSLALAERFKLIQRNRRTAQEAYRVAVAGLELAPRMGATSAEGLLELAGELLAHDLERFQRLKLLEHALQVAAHFDLPAWVQIVVEDFRRTLEALQETEPETVFSLETLLGDSFQSLRRFGLRAEMIPLLDQLEELAHQWEDRVKPHQLFLQIARGRFVFEQESLAWPLLDRVGKLLLSAELSEVKQTQLAQAYVRALGFAPSAPASARLWELFHKLRGIHDTFSTSSHFFLSQLSVVEALVFAMAGDINQLPPSTRRLLDEEEFCLRQRIHRDWRKAMSVSPTETATGEFPVPIRQNSEYK